MAKSYQRRLLIAFLSLAPLFGACERVDISGVSEPVPAQTLAAGHGNKPTKVLKKKARGQNTTVDSDVANRGKSVHLRVGKYELWVPRGAVSGPTTFRMTVVQGDIVGVSLEAWDSKGNPVTQFNVPLHLTLPYDEIDPQDIENESDLLLANIASESDPTILEVVNVSVNKREKTVTGNIWHFSVWSLAIRLKELSPGID